MDNRSSFAPPQSAPPVGYGGAIPSGKELAVNRMHASFTVEGSSAISRLTALPRGIIMTLYFSGAPSLVNGTALICPGGNNIQCASGDAVIVRSLGDGGWRVLAYMPGSISRLRVIQSIDYASGSAAVTAVTAATGGGAIIVPNGATPPTLPTTYPSVAFDYYGPATPTNLYSETGPSESTATRLIRGQLPASTTGIAQSVLAIESRPVGASLNGPTQGSYAVSISSFKQNFGTTTQPGEIGGLNIVVRNGGISGGNQSDSSAVLCNVASIGPSGFAVGVEGVTNNLNTSGVSLKGVRYQLGVVDSVSGSSSGLALISETGTINSGLVLQQTATGTFSSAILVATSVAVVWSVDGSGNTLIAATTASTSTTTGALVVDGGVGVVGAIHAGSAVLGAPLPVASGGTAYGGGAWTPYTCIVTPGAGSITTQTSDSSYLQIGKMVFVSCVVNTPAAGSATGAVSFNLPVAAKRSSILAGREQGVSGVMFAVSVQSGGTTGSAFNYNNTNLTLANGASYSFTGCYEAA